MLSFRHYKICGLISPQAVSDSVKQNRMGFKQNTMGFEQNTMGFLQISCIFLVDFCIWPPQYIGTLLYKIGHFEGFFNEIVTFLSSLYQYVGHRYLHKNTNELLILQV